MKEKDKQRLMDECPQTQTAQSVEILTNRYIKDFLDRFPDMAALSTEQIQESTDMIRGGVATYIVCGALGIDMIEKVLLDLPADQLEVGMKQLDLAKKIYVNDMSLDDFMCAWIEAY
jgi:hypothetical protein